VATASSDIGGFAIANLLEVKNVCRSDIPCAAVHVEKSRYAGKFLEAATGVEPVMEVVQFHPAVICRLSGCP
jgi:hypothetical protein